MGLIRRMMMRRFAGVIVGMVFVGMMIVGMGLVIVGMVIVVEMGVSGAVIVLDAEDSMVMTKMRVAAQHPSPE